MKYSSLVIVFVSSKSSAFLSPPTQTNNVKYNIRSSYRSTYDSSTVILASTQSTQKYFEIGSTLNRPGPFKLTPKLKESVEKNIHPEESDGDLGRGTYITSDWRKAWHTYESPIDSPDLIDPKTGYAEYIIESDDIEGEVPDDLVGVLYRNGPGKFGVNGERVQHVLDADGLITKIIFPPPSSDGKKDGRKFAFKSRFVETEWMKEEEEAKRFLYRGTFGTSPSGFETPPRKGLNEDPWDESVASRIFGSFGKLEIKNSANTQAIYFGGKLLALFEAGLPHKLDPDTLETLGEDDLGGTLPYPTGKGVSPVKLPGEVPTEFTPDFLGGAAHTAHPQMCPDTGNLVGWHWAQLAGGAGLEVTFTEWSAKDFSPVASSTYVLDGCDLAPHDMLLTKNHIMLKVNSLTMNQADFISGMKGPAASLKMDGRANVNCRIFPRPTNTKKKEPISVEVPPCFSIHFSHGYEEDDKLIAYFSGWPPSDSKDFLGAWGGHSPDFLKIPITMIWRIEIDLKKKECISLKVADGSANACAEHPLVHPNFNNKKAHNVYASLSNLVGDSSPPCGFCRLRIEDGDDSFLREGEYNNDIDAYFFGTRIFSGEPLIVPKHGGDPTNEDEAYLLGMFYDAVEDRSGLAIFDLERNLKEGPVAKMYLKSGVPHGLHGCFVPQEGNLSSVFC